MTPESADFPPALRTIPDPPWLLYQRGPRQDGVALAIVGSRRASPRGEQVARTLACAVARAGVNVVSGLAYGIDAAAHLGALEGGRAGTVVLASGIDRPSPSANVRLAQRLLREGGAWLSEYAPGEPALPYRFPERNRLISGLACATLVVEAQEHSGSLWTARHALDQGRDVWIVPGPVDTELCRGSNTLLRDGATPILDATDLLHALGIAPRPASSQAPSAPLSGLAGRIWDSLASGPNDADSLARTLQVAPDELQRTLVSLELDGHVERRGNRIARR